MSDVIVRDPVKYVRESIRHHREKIEANSNLGDRFFGETQVYEFASEINRNQVGVAILHLLKEGFLEMGTGNRIGAYRVKL